jgi:hypothetical protein
VGLLNQGLIMLLVNSLKTTNRIAQLEHVDYVPWVEVRNRLSATQRKSECHCTHLIITVFRNEVRTALAIIRR